MSMNLEFSFHAYVAIGKSLEIGQVPTGFRSIVPITGGKFEGQLNGVVIPGGADWQLIRNDGIMEVEARYTLKTDDGILIYIVNKGMINLDEAYARTSPKFEVSDEKYAWLSESMFVSEITPMENETTPIVDEKNPKPNGVSINFYRIT
ncbi:DUF3237 domain-containing protein [Bacillus sp. Marseille-P3661]|uniref:DUF3237 domain-containing protein n=1 Tax=Bacillus sp. Marseille-P3661 TaxID=1936234 RepID=UPI001C643C2E|nr:DUF3237 domain-containing protein [Bacillus sp. Marseille-P3661]